MITGDRSAAIYDAVDRRAHRQALAIPGPPGRV
jgi:hypothetical protein